jgi:hypothetical protein
LYTYICFCFSLLLNCTELEEANEIYEAMCVIFLSEFETNEVVAEAEASIKLKQSDSAEKELEKWR